MTAIQDGLNLTGLVLAFPPLQGNSSGTLKIVLALTLDPLANISNTGIWEYYNCVTTSGLCFKQSRLEVLAAHMAWLKQAKKPLPKYIQAGNLQRRFKSLPKLRDFAYYVEKLATKSFPGAGERLEALKQQVEVEEEDENEDMGNDEEEADAEEREHLEINDQDEDGEEEEDSC